MKYIGVLFLFLFSLLSADPKTSKQYYTQVEKSLNKILSIVEQNVHIGVEIVSLKTGFRLYEKNSHQLFVPASTNKLFIAGAALSFLGPDYTFETTLATDGKIDQKSLKGNLYIKGSGDPSFTVNHLENLVMQLRLQQIEEIQGDILLDPFAFDEISDGPGWIWDDINSPCYSPMSALTINHNCLDVWVKPANTVANPPEVFAYPKVTGFTIQNLAVTDERQQTLTIERNPKNNQIQIKGEIRLDSALKHFQVPLKNPALYFGNLFQTALKKSQITFKGKVKIKTTPLYAKTLVSHHSSSLSNLLSVLMKHSDNLYADNLFKTLGKVYAKEQGSWKNGAKAIRSHLEDEAKLSCKELLIVDGSGFSRYNLASPHHFIEYLTWAYKEFRFAPEFLASFPINGKEGTLKNRLKEEEPVIRGKTGIMSGVTCLCGFIRTKDQEMLAFSIMINGFTEKGAKYQEDIEDQICKVLANLSKEN